MLGLLVPCVWGPLTILSWRRRSSKLLFEWNLMVCPPELKARGPAHTKQLGWYAEFESRVMQGTAELPQANPYCTAPHGTKSGHGPTADLLAIQFCKCTPTLIAVSMGRMWERGRHRLTAPPRRRRHGRAAEHPPCGGAVHTAGAADGRPDGVVPFRLKR